MKLVNKREPSYYIICSAVIIVGVILDQLTKWLAVDKLQKLDTLPIIEDIFHLTYVENRGAAFGMLADQRWIFIVISIVAIIGFGLVIFLGHTTSRAYALSMSLIVSGGIGNMIDRVTLGYVVDFIDCRFVKYPVFGNSGTYWATFPVFNGADSFVCVGAAVLMLVLVLDIVAESRAAKKEKK